MEKRVCEKTYMKCASIVIPFDFASLLAMDQSKEGDDIAQVPEDTGDLTKDSFIKELFESSAKGGGMVPTFVAMGPEVKTSRPHPKHRFSTSPPLSCRLLSKRSTVSISLKWTLTPANFRTSFKIPTLSRCDNLSNFHVIKTTLC